MRRVLIGRSVVAAVLIGLFAVGCATTPTAGGRGFAGSWRVSVSVSQGPTFVNLSTLGADGTVVNSGLPASEPPPGGPPGVVFSSTQHGAWASTGPDAANVTFVGLAADEQGRALGTSTVRASIVLAADGNTFSGEFVTTLADPAGITVATFAGTVQATRIVAEPPG